ncbi:hypothetical protein ZIOFF_009616 [Zingiber officinale]|uniref:Uncharacterized protein n=1 Tax=Zingiber officinale TaxID=94328 RepID=A0A8J5HY72_ZINOF|nr:hypothetical protein ZIOFF_009616 [Zingiber officinale]
MGPSEEEGFLEGASEAGLLVSQCFPRQSMRSPQYKYLLSTTALAASLDDAEEAGIAEEKATQRSARAAAEMRKSYTTRCRWNRRIAITVRVRVAAITLFPLADASHSSSAGHPRFRHSSTLLGFFRAVALPSTISFLWVSVSEEVCQHLLLPATIHFDCGLSGITAYTSDLDQLRNPYFLVSFCVHFDG